jgi:hypothetical protein
MGSPSRWARDAPRRVVPPSSGRGSAAYDRSTATPNGPRRPIVGGAPLTVHPHRSRLPPRAPVSCRRGRARDGRSPRPVPAPALGARLRAHRRDPSPHPTTDSPACTSLPYDGRSADRRQRSGDRVVAGTYANTSPRSRSVPRAIGHDSRGLPTHPATVRFGSAQLNTWPKWRIPARIPGPSRYSVLWGCVVSTGLGYRGTRAEDAAQASLIRQQNEVPGNRQSTLALAA